ncbi:MAG: TatD family hydrolase, partial [Treponema sp.]|nr:TatD family hydrolase [Treponema sp.]
MLAFSSHFSSYIDAHFHLPCCSLESVEEAFSFFSDGAYYGCTCAHDVDEFFLQEKLVSNARRFSNVNLSLSFGLHPQMPLLKNLSFLETLLEEKRLDAIGEIGFDFFKEYKESASEQEEAWNACLFFAEKYNVPIVVHCRKAMNKIFSYSKKLSLMKAVVFHSFQGSVHEATSLLRRGVNAYFSFGNPLLFGNKSAIECVKELPLNRILLETDAPYQCLRGESETTLVGITRVYDEAFRIRNGIEGERVGNACASGGRMDNFGRVDIGNIACAKGEIVDIGEKVIEREEFALTILKNYKTVFLS